MSGCYFFFSSFGTCRTKATSHRPSLVVLKWRPSPKSSRSRVVHGPFFLVLETETICHTLKINVRNNIPWVAVKKKTLLATLPTCLPAEDDESTCGTSFQVLWALLFFKLWGNKLLHQNSCYSHSPEVSHDIFFLPCLGCDKRRVNILFTLRYTTCRLELPFYVFFWL